MLPVIQRRKFLAVPPAASTGTACSLRHFSGPADVGLWLDLRQRAFARQRVGVGQWTEADFQREFLDKPWWQPERLWFAHPPRTGSGSESQAIGTVALALRGEGPSAKAVVHWLCVLPAWRGRGVGRLLMHAVESAAWDAGYREIWLETHVAWQEAASFYDRLGYLSVDRQQEQQQQ
ncbi:MAG: GNAT family N-acetyltransferase [Planctomycetota bacterium]|nr:GNAT family N-acetyltransferase [Planctomycetota bacterium]